MFKSSSNVISNFAKMRAVSQPYYPTTAWIAQGGSTAHAEPSLKARIFTLPSLEMVNFMSTMHWVEDSPYKEALQLCLPGTVLLQLVAVLQQDIVHNLLDGSHIRDLYQALPFHECLHALFALPLHETVKLSSSGSLAKILQTKSTVQLMLLSASHEILVVDCCSVSDEEVLEVLPEGASVALAYQSSLKRAPHL